MKLFTRERVTKTTFFWRVPSSLTDGREVEILKMEDRSYRKVACTCTRASQTSGRVDLGISEDLVPCYTISGKLSQAVRMLLTPVVCTFTSRRYVDVPQRSGPHPPITNLYGDPLVLGMLMAGQTIV
jgi:hypothetical protein